MKTEWILAAFGLVSLCAGCSSLSPGEYADRKQNSLHIIAANGQGHPVDPLTHDRLSDSAYENRVMESIDALLEAPQDTVVIYIHGGMVALNQSLDQAFEIAPSILADDMYPLFFNWHSELFDSYFDHLLWIRNGERKKLWGPVTMPLVALADVGRGVSRFPITWYSQLRTDWNTTKFRKENNVLDALDFQKTLRKQYLENTASSIAVNSGNHDSTFWDSAGRFCGWLVTLPFKYGVSAPVLEMVGTPAWDNMTRRTSLVFDQQEDFELRETNAPDPFFKLKRGSSGPFGLYFASLHKRMPPLKSNDQTMVKTLGQGKKLILIAHSMGTIVANQILERYPDVKFDRIIYMAAACSVRDGYGAILPYLDRHQEAQFHNLCLNWRAEKREVNAFDLPIRGSLLEWLDAIFVQPETVLDQRMGKWVTTMRTASQVPQRLRSRVTFKTFDVTANDRTKNPVKHGDFDEGEFWKPEFWNVEPSR